MRYFELFDDIRVKGRWHLGEAVDRSDYKSLELWRGRPIDPKTAIQVEVTDHGRALDFSLTSFAAPLARASLARRVAGAAGGDVQVIPVTIPGYAGFSILNSVRVVECLDEKSSQFTKWTKEDHRADLAGTYRMVVKLRINPELVPPDAHFFRVKGWEIALIVSELVKTAIEASGCVGAKFEDVI